MALVPEPEHGREAGRQIVSEEELVELADGLDASWETRVHHVAVLGDELAAEGDSVEIFRVDGDELGGGIRLQGFCSCELRVGTCSCAAWGLYRYVRVHVCRLTHGDVEDGFEWPILGGLDCLPVQAIQRPDLQRILGCLCRSWGARC